MRHGRIEWTLVTPLRLFTVSERAPACQPMAHVQGGHSEKNGNEKDCRNKKQ
jgi:hypothetical protein